MRTVALVLALTTTLQAGSALAENKDVAREAFHQATLLYDLADFKAALANFKKAYLNFEDPAFLFNIAQCQRQLGEKAEALRTYRVWLSKAPNARQRGQVEKIVAELQAALEHDRAALNRQPTGTMAPDNPPPHGATVRSDPATADSPFGPSPASSEPPAAPQSAPAATDSSSTAATVAVATSAPRADKPLTKKAWFWGAVAGGAVVVAGAITLGVVLGTRHNSIELTY